MKKFLQKNFGISFGASKNNDNQEEQSEELIVIPYYYAQCITSDQKIGWLHSERGQEVLKNRPVPLEFYNNGRIFRLIQEPMWKKKLEEWLYEEPLPPSAPVISIEESNFFSSEAISNLPSSSGAVVQVSSSSSSSTSSNLPIASKSTTQTHNIFGLALPKTEDDAEKERRDTRFNDSSHPLSMNSLSKNKKLRKELKEKYYNILKNSLESSIYFQDHNLPSYEKYDSSYPAENLSIQNTFADIFEASNNFFSSATLTDEQIYHLYQYGYVILRGVLSEELVNTCVVETEKEIFLKKGTVGNDLMEICLSPEKRRDLKKDKGNSHRERKMASIRMDFNPDFLSGSCSLVSILALYYNSPLHHMIDNLLHGLKVYDNTEDEKKSIKKSHSSSHDPLNYFPIQGCQIGYRFGQSGSNKRTIPVLRDSTLAHSPYNIRNAVQGCSFSSSSAPQKYVDAYTGGVGPDSWHIDGLMGGIYGSFSLLIAVPLSDQDNPFMGNFCVHPESHTDLLPYLHQFYLKSEENKDKQYADRENGVKSIPKPKLQDGVMVSVKKGDVILAFHKTAHLGGPNFSDRIRKMAFFRTSHINHNQLRFESFDNFMIEYEGMQEVLCYK